MREPETSPYPAWPTKVWAPYSDLRIRVTQKGQGQYAMEIWRAATDGAYDYTVIRDLTSFLTVLQ